MKRLRPVITVLFIFITMAFSLSFATSSHAITITGTKPITTNSSASYSTAGCDGTVSWGVTGTGASISSNGILTAGSAPFPLRISLFLRFYKGDYDRYSFGADKAAGGEGENADIVSWK